MAIDPARFGLPDETTTGVTPGTSLKPYTGPSTITQDGTVIENAIIDGTLSVKAANVTIKNSIIQNFGWWGVEGEGAENLHVENTKFVGLGQTEATNSAILGSGTFVGNDIQGVAIGIQLTDGASTVRGNYIHDLASNAADPHYDGVTALGGQSNVVIEGNSIFAPQDHGTASILIQNTFGPVDNLAVRDNLMVGDPSYTLYVDGSRDGGPITNVTVEDNYVERGYYGYFSVENSDPVIRNNVQWQEGTDPTPYPADAAGAAPTTAAQPEATPDVDPTQLEETTGDAGDGTLTGGDHDDTFVFDTALDGSNNIERITNFSVADDTLQLDHSVFTALNDIGTLPDSAFVKNKAGIAQDADDRIVYETDTGALYYDANGNADGGSVHFATLKPHLHLTADDFAVI